jgi:thioredoxin 1
MVKQLTNETFDTDVLKQDLPVIIDFYAQWCGPCRQMAPHLEDAARQTKDKYVFCKVDVDENRDLAIKHGIASLPTLVVYNKGVALDSVSGFMPREEILATIEKILSAA